MKKLKANSITFYESIEELKKSRNDEPFDKKKHMKYVKKLDRFHDIIKKLNVDLA
jgi:hypothetical protein